MWNYRTVLTQRSVQWLSVVTGEAEEGIKGAGENIAFFRGLNIRMLGIISSRIQVNINFRYLTPDTLFNCSSLCFDIVPERKVALWIIRACIYFGNHTKGKKILNDKLTGNCIKIFVCTETVQNCFTFFSYER